MGAGSVGGSGRYWLEPQSPLGLDLGFLKNGSKGLEACKNPDGTRRARLVPFRPLGAKASRSCRPYKRKRSFYFLELISLSLSVPLCEMELKKKKRTYCTSNL